MMTGECIYCGQIKQVNLPDKATEDERNRQATMNCKCGKSLEVQKFENMKEKARKNINTLFYKKYPEMEEILNAALIPISEKKLDKVTVKVGRVTGSILMTGKGNIKVERSAIQKEAIESE